MGVGGRFLFFIFIFWTALKQTNAEKKTLNTMELTKLIK